MVTYADVFQFGIFIVALIGLCHNIFKRKKVWNLNVALANKDEHDK